MNGRDRYDVIVVGVGGVGSATAYRLARRGADVLGLERFDVPHGRGSSFGTRLILPAGHRPTPEALDRRAYALWRDLETETGRRLLSVTGSLGISPAGGEQFENELRACRRHGVDHEVLTGSEVSERFPAYDLPADYEAVFQPGGGFLDCDRCIAAHVEAAHRHGAEIRARERVTGWRSTPTGVDVTTTRGEYEAAALVVTAGAWAGKLVDSLRDLLTPELHLTARFQPTAPERFAPENFPVFSMTAEEGFCYGTPIHRTPGFKFAHGRPLERPTDPDAPDREPTVEDESRLRRVAERYFPEGVGATMGLKTGFITWTADRSYSSPVLDTLPEAENVVVGAGFSGGGFSSAPVTGEILADLALDGRTDYDTDRFSMRRFD
ncbi:N-methyl-L-tryptophan oxidase [Halomarina pelagica]|uniref:N-methyl-L-tryptophan oxidase n=1 Tax=Halomarina pelagica TaxID=2961599 RepID=UPI0020C45751|nr:N-methyl-L-tryptophan oxidase [Halomarina sp. BND7]